MTESPRRHAELILERDSIWGDEDAEIVARAYLETERAFRQACSNLANASFRGKDITLGDEAALWQGALLAGWGGIEGWPP